MLTWRDLKVIIMHLPPDSALGRRVQPELAPWDLNAYLLSILINKLGNLGHVITKQRGKYKAEITPPRPQTREIEGPKRPVRRVQGSTITEMDKWLRDRRAAGKL